MTEPRFLFSDIVFASTTKTQLCPCAAGRAFIFGGSAGTHIHKCSARTDAASLYAGGIYA